MAEQADNYWADSTGPGGDPGAGFPQPTEDLDALLNTVACETFDDGRAHRMMEGLRLRMIADSLQVRDRAAAEFLELLREKEAMSRPVLPFPSPPVGAGSGAGAGGPVAAPPQAKARPWVLRRPPKPVARLALSACVIVGLGMAGWAGYRHGQTDKAERLRGDDNFRFVEGVITQFCAPVPGTCLPPHPSLRDTNHQELYLKALRSCQEFLAAHQVNPAMHRETGRVQYWMGCIQILLGQPHEARTALAGALPPLQALADELPEQPAYRRMVGEVRLNLAGLLAQETATAPEAEESFEQALGDFRELTRRHPGEPTYRFQLAMAHEQLGAFLHHAGRRPEAEREFHRTQRLLTDLEKEAAAASPPYRLGLAQSHRSLGALHLAAGQYDEALERFRKATAILAKLPADAAGVAESRGYLAGQWNELGKRLFGNGRAADARHAYTQARDLWDELVRAFPQDADYHGHLGFALLQLALVVRAQGQLDDGCRLLATAVEHDRTALALKPQSKEVRESLRDVYRALAATQLRRGDHREAAAAAVRIPQVNPNRWEEHFRAVSFLARCLVAAEGDTRLTPAERRELTASYAGRLWEYREQLARRTASNAGASNALAWFLATCPKPELRDPDQALVLARNATRLQPRQAVYRNTLGVAYFRTRQWDEAVAALQQSMKLSGEGCCADWLFLAMALQKLDREPEARRWYDRAVAWMDAQPTQDEELHRFRDEATKLIGPSGALTRAEVTAGLDE